MKKFLFLVVLSVAAQWLVAQVEVTVMLPNPCTGVGIADYVLPGSAMDFDVYPNPSDGNFTLSIRDEVKVGKVGVTIIGMRGDLIMQESYFSSNQEMQTQINLNVFAAGTYVITVEGEHGKLSKQLIVTR